MKSDARLHGSSPHVVDTMEQSPRGFFFLYEGQAGTRAFRGRSIVERQQNPCEGLDNENKNNGAAEDIAPPRAAWNRLLENLSQNTGQTRAFFEPVDEPLHLNPQAGTACEAPGRNTWCLT